MKFTDRLSLIIGLSLINNSVVGQMYMTSVNQSKATRLTHGPDDVITTEVWRALTTEFFTSTADGMYNTEETGHDNGNAVTLQYMSSANMPSTYGRKLKYPGVRRNGSLIRFSSNKIAHSITPDIISFNVTTSFNEKFENISDSKFQNDTIQRGSVTYSSSSSLTLKLLYLITGTIAVLGNSLTSFVMLYDKHLRSKITNIFIVNQSLIDLFSASIMIIVQFTDDITWVPDGAGMLLFCRLWLSKTVMWGAFFTSTFNLVIMTWERYFAIVHALSYNKHFTRSRARILMVLIWVAGQAWGSYCFFSTNIVDGECRAYSVWPSAEFATAFGFVVVSIQYFIPILMLLFSYGSIIFVLNRKANAGVMKLNGKEPSVDVRACKDQREVKMIRARANVIKILILVGLFFMLCWGPNQIMYFINNLGVHLDYTAWYFHFSVMLTSANCCINPIIYTCKYKRFQKSLRKLFNCGQKRNQSSVRSFSDFKLSESVATKLSNEC